MVSVLTFLTNIFAKLKREYV